MCSCDGPKAVDANFCALCFCRVHGGLQSLCVQVKGFILSSSGHILIISLPGHQIKDIVVLGTAACMTMARDTQPCSIPHVAVMSLSVQIFLACANHASPLFCVQTGKLEATNAFCLLKGVGETCRPQHRSLIMSLTLLCTYVSGTVIDTSFAGHVCR